jgi:hypothetical protein
MDSRSLNRAPIQVSGYFDMLTNEYALTICSGGLVATIEFLKEEDVREILSCVSCMLLPEDNLEHDERQTDLDHPAG